MTGTAWMLLSWVLVGAAFLVIHVLALWHGLRAGALDRRWRLLALLPPATPVVAWVNGARVAPVLWAVTGLVYLALRIVGG